MSGRPDTTERGLRLNRDDRPRLRRSPGRLVGVILPAGRVAGDRPELFVGSGVQTPADGIALLPEHRSSRPGGRVRFTTT